MPRPSRDQVAYGLLFPEIVILREGVFTDVNKTEVLVEEVMGVKVIPIKSDLPERDQYEEFHARIGAQAPDGANAFRRGRVFRGLEVSDLFPGEQYDLHAVVYLKTR